MKFDFRTSSLGKSKAERLFFVHEAPWRLLEWALNWRPQNNKPMEGSFSPLFGTNASPRDREAKRFFHDLVYFQPKLHQPLPLFLTRLRFETTMRSNYTRKIIGFVSCLFFWTLQEGATSGPSQFQRIMEQSSYILRTEALTKFTSPAKRGIYLLDRRTFCVFVQNGPGRVLVVLVSMFRPTGRKQMATLPPTLFNHSQMEGNTAVQIASRNCLKIGPCRETFEHKLSLHCVTPFHFVICSP